ncbi:thioredoxin-like protein [Gigaspora rosea]|uniref:Thioredoxin-like protein n=1 Tax=Gigaspora rosea TaxID=44941 RepID=A0A397US62_9GLOM|nr:thioredoxin-like protein [Gigaspora rosea]CAG8695905.1 25539_t:CDS:2 [Gigaspora rosea]
MVLVAILTACVSLVRNILQAFLYFIIPRPAITDPQANRIRDSRLTAQFIQKFEEKYGNTHPEFFQGSYSQALDRAKNDLRFAMIILQADEHDNTKKFNRETLTSDLLISFLRENDFLVWAGNIKDPEAFQVNSILQATTYPFVAVIVLATPHGNTGMSPRMTVVDRIEGLLSPEILIARFTILINRYGSGLQRIRNERAERDSARQIREQQDSAYLASLQADQEKERKARELAEAKKLASERAKREEEERMLLLANKEKWRRWALTQLPNEPNQNETNVTSLSFRLLNGERVVRRFRADDTVEMIYIFVDTYHMRKETSSSSTVHQPPEDYVHTFDFLLVSPFPRTVHHVDKLKTIKNVSGLWPSANLIVEGLTSDDDE